MEQNNENGMSELKIAVTCFIAIVIIIIGLALIIK